MGKSPFPSVPDPADTPDEPPFEPDVPAEPTPPARVNDGGVPTGEVGISFKFGTGYEAPMIHFKASSLEGLADLTGYDRGSESGPELLFGVTEYFAEASKFVTGTYTKVTGRKLGATGGSGSSGSGSAGSGGSGGQRRGTPPEANEPPAWMGDPPSCDHGPRKYVSKVKPDGSRWHAWGCSGEQGDNCSPGLQFVNAPKGK